MAYFSNGTEGECFEEQCSLCIFGDNSCPIAEAQSIYNYDAVKNKTSSEILNSLVKDDGTCTMFERFYETLGLKI